MRLILTFGAVLCGVSTANLSSFANRGFDGVSKSTPQADVCDRISAIMEGKNVHPALWNYLKNNFRKNTTPFDKARGMLAACSMSDFVDNKLKLEDDGSMAKQDNSAMSEMQKTLGSSKDAMNSDEDTLFGKSMGGGIDAAAVRSGINWLWHTINAGGLEYCKDMFRNRKPRKTAHSDVKKLWQTCVTLKGVVNQNRLTCRKLYYERPTSHSHIQWVKKLGLSRNTQNLCKAMKLMKGAGVQPPRKKPKKKRKPKRRRG